MEVSDIHVGKQLQVNYSPAGVAPIPCTAYGFGASAVPGTGFFNGGVMVGSPIVQPAHLATLQVTRPDLINANAAKAPSIVRIVGNPTVAPPTPIDVVIGDITGPVGVSMVVTTLVIKSTLSTLEESPFKKSTIGLTKNTGTKVNTGAKQETGAQSQSGAEVRASAKSMAGPLKVSGPISAKVHQGSIFTGRALGNKTFDIKHPTKSGWRLRHTCVEGPENAVFFRGKLDGENVINLPEYWKGLINYDTISVNLTAFGRRDTLYVKDIQEDRIIISGDHLTNVKCYYQVWADRSGEPLIVEYEGETPADYPGDSSSYSVAGYDYDVRDNK